MRYSCSMSREPSIRVCSKVSFNGPFFCALHSIVYVCVRYCMPVCMPELVFAGLFR